MTKRLITCDDCGKTECVCGSENWRVSRTPESAGSDDILDHAMMDILYDVYGAYHLIPEADRSEYEAKYGKPNNLNQVEQNNNETTR